jgi:hypothetical protein
MTNEEVLGITLLNSRKLVMSRFDKTLGDLTDEQLQQQVAPGKNRVFYLLGDLTTLHDRMFPLLGLGDRLHPELDDTYIEVNNKLTAAFTGFALQDWLKKHAAVSEEDFVNDPERNQLAFAISRTNHASYHSGRAIHAV